MNQIEITELNIYPVKSLKGISLTESELTINGLKYDRNWMIIDTENNFITQRQIPELAKISTKITEKHLILNYPDSSEIKINLTEKENPEIETFVWNHKCIGYSEGTEVSEWLTEKIGKTLRLIRFSKNFTRKVENEYLRGEKSSTLFADGFPFLICSEESLQYLNSELAKNDTSSVPMNRFRANIVIKNISPFDEFKISELTSQNDNYTLGLRKPCKRCKIVTINQDNSEIKNPKEPLLTLSKINPLADKQGAYFGINSTLLNGENQKIKVGDFLKLIY